MIQQATTEYDESAHVFEISFTDVQFFTAPRIDGIQKKYGTIFLDVEKKIYASNLDRSYWIWAGKHPR